MTLRKYYARFWGAFGAVYALALLGTLLKNEVVLQVAAFGLLGVIAYGAHVWEVRGVYRRERIRELARRDVRKELGA